MKHYQLYSLTTACELKNVHEIVAGTDEAALAAALEVKATSRCEVWTGTRLVARLVSKTQPYRVTSNTDEELCKQRI